MLNNFRDEIHQLSRAGQYFRKTCNTIFVYFYVNRFMHSSVNYNAVYIKNYNFKETVNLFYLNKLNT